MTTVSEETASTAPSSGARGRKGTGLEAMLLPELKRLASTMGLKGTTGMRKGDLIAAIKSAQSKNSASKADTPTSEAPKAETRKADAPKADTPRADARRADAATSGAAKAATPTTDDARSESSRREAPENTTGRDRSSQAQTRSGDEASIGRRERNGRERNGRDRSRHQSDRSRGEDNRAESNEGGDDITAAIGARLEEVRRELGGTTDAPAAEESSAPRERDHDRRPQHNNGPSANQRHNDDDDGSRRGRRRRNRDRQGRRGRNNDAPRGMEAEPTVNEGDVLIPVSGILDVMDNYAFVRRGGYLPGPEDAYVSLGLVKRFGLRKGDVITGVLREPTDGERREKFNPLVRVETVNGAAPEEAKNRPDFAKLTPLYPQDRLRLETSPTLMTGRIVDLVAPIGKGQRGLIVSPPKAGKTMIMQQIANAITTNNPEVHLMVVLVDERPEEVTDFQRSVKGEVIASTFDRPADDHTTVAELAIERAKRLVELGHDVVILLDGITRLGRAYNLAAPASGRILSGGVDSAALYPPKKFFGAARNIEDGGSLTILATALVDTGSKMDEVIFEEFKGTGNMELRLRRDLAEKRIFPAIDVDASSTRREELLLGKEELAIMWKLRRVLSGLDAQQSLEMLRNRMRKTESNNEFLTVISRTTPGRED